MYPLLIVVLIVLGVLGALAFVAAMFGVGIYNKLVALRNRFKNAYAQIDVQLKGRYDLIPNLVETAKGFIQQERGTLEAVIAARNAAMPANSSAAANPGEPAAMKQLVSAELLHKLDVYWRAANYLSVGQIYLNDNPLLKRPLALADVKHILLGHWGTTSGHEHSCMHLKRGAASTERGLDSAASAGIAREQER